jgi:hypothetical protein
MDSHFPSRADIYGFMLWRSSAPGRRPEGFIEPCLPTLADAVPTGPQWAYEIKYDGYRFICPVSRSPLRRPKQERAR